MFENDPGIVNRFLMKVLEDKEGPGVAPVDHYLGLFPGHEQTIRTEYEALSRGLDGAAEPSSGDEVGEVSLAASRADGWRLGPYVVEQELGRGGQAVVYRARDTRLPRVVALKVMKIAEAGLLGLSLERFRREAEAASRLDHPGICAVHEVGEADGLLYLTMPYVKGRSLDAHVREAAAGTDGALLGDRGALERVLEIFAQLADALHYSHEAGIIHRDVKPRNVMLTEDGRPVLLDFGIAHDTTSPKETLTRTGDVVGSPAYMSPEQIRGDRVGPRTDVYSLAVTLYESLAHELPYRAVTRESLFHSIMNDDPRSIRAARPDLPRDLAVVLEVAMAKNPTERYVTAAAFADDLRRVARGAPVAVKPVSAARHVWRWVKRRPALASALMLAFVSLVGALVLTLERNRALDLAYRAVDHERERAQGALADVTKLADGLVLRRLVRRADELWPAHPDRADELRSWLDEASTLLEHVGAHREVLARLSGGGQPRLDDDWEFAGHEAAWIGEALARLLEEVDAFTAEETGAMSSVKRRLAFAESVRRRSIDDHLDAWSAADAAIAGSARYDGSPESLKPQLGLVPLGTDPDSGLQLFLHLATHTGPLPARDPENGRLEITTNTGLVLVLVPGDFAFIGSQARDPEEPNYFEDLPRDRAEGPVEEIDLDPFFLAKHEMTQAQWRRVTLAEPSFYRPDVRVPVGVITGLHPVESITFHEAVEILRRHELTLPTEAQWEYAARAGTTWPRWCGATRDDLTGAANICDATALQAGAPWSGFEDWFEDGFVVHGPVNTLRPNPFGLHHVYGNVAEICLDPFGDKSFPLRDGDGARQVPDPTHRTVRGGSFSGSAAMARSAYREVFGADERNPGVGLRPARAVDRDD